MLPPGEKIVFYHEIRESALFYTDRGAVALHDPESFEKYIDHRGALAIVDLGWVYQIEKLASRYRVVDRYGNKIIVEGVGEPDHMRE
jgi:hypothetical protein